MQLPHRVDFWTVGKRLDIEAQANLDVFLREIVTVNQHFANEEAQDAAFVRKRSANPRLRVGANQGNAVFFQFHGRSSWSFLLGQVGSFSSTSQR